MQLPFVTGYLNTLYAKAGKPIKVREKQTGKAGKGKPNDPRTINLSKTN